MHPEIAMDQIIIPHWHPNQLRHTKVREIRREAGLDAARVVLGHRSAQITERIKSLSQRAPNNWVYFCPKSIHSRVGVKLHRGFESRSHR
jgi:hypothetical protein